METDERLRREWQPTPVVWTWKPHGQRSLAGLQSYSQWDHKELDMTEHAPEDNTLSPFQQRCKRYEAHSRSSFDSRIRFSGPSAEFTVHGALGDSLDFRIRQTG